MRRVLTPKWWLLHLAVLAAVLVMLRLGLWQWHRANSPSGGIQNYAYAGQWPLFAVFAVVLWVRTLVEEVRRPRGVGSAPDGLPAQERRPMPSHAEVEHRPGVVIGVRTVVPEVAPEDDPEVAAWNARLAALNAKAAAVPRRGR
jgi:hypothetical protein